MNNFESFISNCLKDSKKLFELYLKEKSYEHIDRFLQFWNSYKYSKRVGFYSANHYWINFDYYDYEKLYKDMMFVLQNSKQIIRCLHFKEHLNNVSYAPFVLLSLIRSKKLHMCMLKVIYGYYYSVDNKRINAIKQVNKKIYPLDKK